jgi:RHS repeat-associated protein
MYSQIPNSRFPETCTGWACYGFNGKEKDDEWSSVTGADFNYGSRIYDARIGKFLSVDPLSKNFPAFSPYLFACNMPISASDLDGEEYVIRIYSPVVTEKIQNAVKSGDVQTTLTKIQWCLSNKFENDFAKNTYTNLNIPDNNYVASMYFDPNAPIGITIIGAEKTDDGTNANPIVIAKLKYTTPSPKVTSKEKINSGGNDLLDRIKSYFSSLIENCDKSGDESNTTQGGGFTLKADGFDGSDYFKNPKALNQEEDVDISQLMGIRGGADQIPRGWNIPKLMTNISRYIEVYKASGDLGDKIGELYNAISDAAKNASKPNTASNTTNQSPTGVKKVTCAACNGDTIPESEEGNHTGPFTPVKEKKTDNNNKQ